jgi:sigma-B regulation protein RsbU (phosphoserine phosphatase)
LGWESDELLGRPLEVLEPEGSPNTRWWHLARNQGLSRIVETAGRRKDGSIVDLDIAFSEMRLHDQQMFAAFVRDITERKRHLLEIRRSREEFAAAREIQQRLFPRQAPLIPGFDLSGASFPAEAAGGDYYDYLHLPDSSVGIRHC